MSTLTSQETLILIGAAVAAGCRPCLEAALGRSHELGLAAQDIIRAREIGAMAANRARADMEEHVVSALSEFVPGFSGQPVTKPCSCKAPSASPCQA